MEARVQPFARSSLTLGGLAGALALRLAVAGNDGAASVPAGLVFAAALVCVALLAGWRPASLRPTTLLLGAAGAAGLVGIPAWLRLTGPPAVSFPTEMWPLWVAIVSAVAIAEELVLHGSLFTLLEREHGPYAAVALTSVVFALIHVPLYGWGVLPIDLAAGVWLGGIRLVSGGPAAPAITHVLADLATWWLL